MPRGAWSAKRERQYDDIRKSLLARGRPEKLAGEIAARTVNKVRAQQGESKTASPATLNDVPPSRRGGEHSHLGSQGRTYAQLYADAKRAGLAGRSRRSAARPPESAHAAGRRAGGFLMSKAGLERALKR